MTHQVKGVVDTCTQRDQKTRNGMGTIHGCIVDGVEFETGFNKKHSEGTMVSVAVKWDYGKWNQINGDGEGMPAATAGGQVKAVGGTAAPRGKAKGEFPVPPDHYSMSIIRQNSMGHATKIVDDMYKHGVLTSVSTTDDYLKEVVETALSITEFSSGQDMKAVLKAAVGE